ncbi:MAG: S8 family serine peptidase [Adhaeribacter sp.]
MIRKVQDKRRKAIARFFNRTLPLSPHPLAALWLLAWLLAPPAQAQQQNRAEAFAGGKASPALQQALPQASACRVLVQNQAAFRQWLARRLPQARLRDPRPGSDLMEVENLAAGQLQQVLAAPGLLFADLPNRPARAELALPQADLSVNHITALHRQFPALTGQGLAVSVKEQAFDTTDIDLKGRILPGQQNLQGPASGHATTMATLIGGAGNSAPSGRGVAPGVLLASAGFAELLPDDGAALLAAGVTVQNHSYGVEAVENYYGLEARAYDQQALLYPQLLHVFSAGNAGTRAADAGPYAGLTSWANLTGQFKMAKNTLSVGATDARGLPGKASSRGPAHDGRLKPELAAYGPNGSSEAAALVSGMALLCQQAYRDQHAGALPPAALVKAALVNSARDLGRPGPDFETGYGQADAAGAVRTMLEKRFFSGTLQQGQQLSFPLSLPPGTGKLTITLVWHDPAAAPNAGRALIHDLDLRLQHAGSGQSWLPWVLSAFAQADSLRLPARRGADRLNNVEQITVDSPPAGAYTLQVAGYQVSQGSQDFHVAYAYESGLAWQYPDRDHPLQPGQKQTIRWQSALPAGTTGRLEYRLGSQGPWLLIAGQVPLAGGSYDWHPPDTTGLAQLQLSAPGGAVRSEAFLLAPALPLRSGYNCPDALMLSWPALPGAAGYQVYRLGSRQLEPYRQTADTLLVVAKTAGPPSFYAVAPLIQDQAGLRSHSLADSGSACYVLSLLPRQLVTDTVVFDVLLSTTYQVQSLTWQKLEKGVFRTLQTISPVSSPQLALSDPQPQPGRNDYRLLVTTLDGRQVASSSEYLFYAPAGYLLVYPNPLPSGRPLQVVLAGDQATDLVLYDSSGRVAWRYQESGAIKELPTAGLKPGIFLLRARTPGGRYLSARLVIYP